MKSPDGHVTSYQLAVYDAVRMIPRGKVASYATVAAMAGRGTGRTVGTALAKYPFGPETPCHRVVKADGSVGGYGGEPGGPEASRKEKLLRAEGVKFQDSGKIDPACFLLPE